MAPTKNITLRLPADDYLLVESLAEAVETSVSEVIRDAITQKLTQAAHDPGVVKTVEQINRRRMDLWNSLATG